MSQKIRIGIAGFDHFFAALGAVQELGNDPDAEIVILAHHDAEKAQQTAEKVGAKWTTNYTEVVNADIDLLITACPTNQNKDLVIAGVNQGKHILSVKPFAMNMQDADEIVAAVKRAGVRFMSFDASWRFNPLYQEVKQWLAAGELGQPFSTFCLMRSSLPDFVWFGDPFERGRSWWLDPQQSPGGGWIDHSIYYVDALRWVFGSDVARVSGETAHFKHVDEPQEDFGVATMVFKNGVIATIEVTWHIEGPGMVLAFQLVGSSGEVLSESTIRGPEFKMTNEIRRTQFGAGSPGWEPVELPASRGGLTTHMLAVLRGEAEPITNEDESRSTLAACLAFYQAAKEHRSVEL